MARYKESIAWGTDSQRQGLCHAETWARMLTQGASLDGQQRDRLGLGAPGQTPKTALRKQISPSARELSRKAEAVGARRPEGTHILPLASWAAWGGGLNLMRSKGEFESKIIWSVPHSETKKKMALLFGTSVMVQWLRALRSQGVRHD